MRPGIAGHVALMPDAHLGKGATVGSVIPTYLDTIIPAAVGVDIGCGMIAVRTNKTGSDLPEDLTPLVGLFGRSIPAGVGGEHRPGKGESRRAHAVRTAQWFKDNPLPHAEGLDERRGHRQLGTLGVGQPLRGGMPRHHGARLGGAPLRFSGHWEPHRRHVHPARAGGEHGEARRPRPGGTAGVVRSSSTWR